MTNWRERILLEFTDKHAASAPLTILADPDELFTDQRLLDQVREAGFDVEHFENGVLFRHLYEAIYRPAWARGKEKPLLIVVSGGGREVETLPFDLLERARSCGRMLSQFTLGELFPTLAPEVLKELEKADLEFLVPPSIKLADRRIDENQSREHVLRTLFSVDPASISGPVEFLRVLMDRHRRRRVWPPGIANWLIERIRDRPELAGWPIRRLVQNPDDFLVFLQERWSIFVRGQLADGRTVGEGASEPALQIDGPTSLPLGAPELRGYLEQCFADGSLIADDSIEPSLARGAWFAVGVAGTARSEASGLGQTLTEVEQHLLDEGASWNQWIEFALRWAHCERLRFTLPESAINQYAQRLLTLNRTLDERFGTFLEKSFGSLYQCQSSLGPVMVHHAASHLRRVLFGSAATGKAKAALIVIDGLALPQWFELKRRMRIRDAWEMNERACFAWIPTITAISRQSILAGEIPAAFASSIGSTQKEESLWNRLWQNAGLSTNEFAFVKQGQGETEAQLMVRLEPLAARPKLRALAVIIGTVDQLVHGMPAGLGIRGVYSGLGKFAEILQPILEGLLAQGFGLFLMSDHGNLETTGAGKPKMGSLPEGKGERAWLFGDEETRATAQTASPGSVLWPPVGLPSGYLPLLAPPAKSFSVLGGTSVSHGGASISEVIVPFISIRNRL